MDIKQLIKDYINVDDEITEANSLLKSTREKKKDLEKSIKEYMLNNNISKVDIGNGTLKILTSKTQKKLGKEDILTTLLDTLEEQKASEIINELFSEGEDNEVTKLSRTKKRTRSKK
jgi:hypothetical protein